MRDRARALLLLLASISAGCDRTESVRTVLEAAVAAHGGRDRIDALGSVTIRGAGRFRDRTSLESTILYAGPSRWSVDAEAESGVRMRFGVDGEQCWREDRHLVRLCSEEDRADYAIFGEVLGARLGRGLEASRFRHADPVMLDGERAPALRAGSLVYVFDPAAHHLAQIRRGDAIEALHGHARVQGVLVAMRRTLTIGGELDVEDRWESVAPGADPAGLSTPAPPRAGATIDWVDPERWVAWTETSSLDPATIRSLEALARDRGHAVSASDGLVLTPLEGGRWRVAITLETGEPAIEGALHVERWPASRVAGIFHPGDPRTAIDAAPALERWMSARGLTPREGARREILAPRLEPSDGALSLLRIACE